jgi:hypothetical protein
MEEMRVGLVVVDVPSCLTARFIHFTPSSDHDWQGDASTTIPLLSCFISCIINTYPKLREPGSKRLSSESQFVSSSLIEGSVFGESHCHGVLEQQHHLFDPELASPEGSQ